MRFPVTGEYLSQASQGRLVFTGPQAKRIRRQLRDWWEYDQERVSSFRTRVQSEEGD